MDVICIYENPAPTVKERAEELKSTILNSSVEEIEQELSRYNIERVPDWPIEDMRIWTQEEYDEIIMDLRTDHWTMYVIVDL